MSKLTHEQVTRFSEQVKKGILNYPKIAKSQGLDWMTVRNDPVLKAEIAVAQEWLKYELLDGVYSVAKNGKAVGKSTAELAYVNAIIKWFDTNKLKDDDASSELTSAQIDERWRRMGLDNSTK